MAILNNPAAALFLLVIASATASGGGLRGQLQAKLRNSCFDGATWWFAGDGGNKGCYAESGGACCGSCDRTYCQTYFPNGGADGNGGSWCSQCTIKPSSVAWHLVASPDTPSTTWEATSTQSYSDETKTAIKASFGLSLVFEEVFTVSSSLESSVEATVTTSLSRSTTQKCSNTCPAGTYLWAQGFSTSLVTDGMLLPQCTQITCSTYGAATPPRCPWGYCGDGDCQWCTSNEWASDPTAANLPPTNPGCLPGEGGGNPQGTCSSSAGTGGKGTGVHCGGLGTATKCSVDKPVCCATDFSGLCLPAGAKCDCGAFSCTKA